MICHLTQMPNPQQLKERIYALNPVQLTEKGEKVYRLNQNYVTSLEEREVIIRYIGKSTTHNRDFIIASNPIELKALVDMGLLKIN